LTMNRLAAHLEPFGGDSYVAALDRERLSLQIERVLSFALGVRWKTLSEMKSELEKVYFPTKFPEQSISARLRDLRKPPYLCRLEKRRRGTGGTFEYQLFPPLPFRPQHTLFIPEKAEKSERRPNANRVDATREADNGEGRTAFLLEARRVAGLLGGDEKVHAIEIEEEKNE
jgi:hypothetical protein